MAADDPTKNPAILVAVSLWMCGLRIWPQSPAIQSAVDAKLTLRQLSAAMREKPGASAEGVIDHAITRLRQSKLL